MPGRSTHTPLVGRQRELRFLLERLDAAGRGAGGVVLVGGEPGIGKTRLVTELTRRARADGWQVLIGHAFDAEGMPPYVPFVEPLRGHVNGESAEALRQQLSRNAAAVALLLPEIRDRLPDLPVAQTADPEHARYHLFESMTAFVQSIARQQRLLFVLEDLHWADKPTVLLLQHLVRGIADAPLLVVATFRTTDLERTHPLVDVLADLRRERRAERLTLGALSLEDVAALIEGLAGALPAAAVTAAVERGTDGNPFFVEEVVQHLRGEGRDLTDTSTAVAEWGIPEGVREVIGRRLARLDADANALLRAGAILGAGFALDLLAAMGEIQPDSRLVAALEQAEGAGLLREDDGGYRFTHALIRETILAGLSLPRRQHLHLRAAEAIEGVHAARLGPHAGALALHFQAAGAAAASDKRLEYTRAAAEHAIEVFAWEEATAHLQAALDLTDPTDAAARCDLLLALGHTLNNTGEPSRTVDEVAPDALHAAESVGDADRASQVCQMALDALFLIGSFEMAATPEYRFWAEQADRHAAPDSAARVRADSALAVVARLAGRPRKSWNLAWRAVDLARELNDDEALFAASVVLLAYEWAPLRTHDVYQLAIELMQHSRDGVHLRTLANLLGPGSGKFLDQGDRVRAEAMSHEFRTLAARTRNPFLEIAASNIVGQTPFDTVDGRLEAAAGSGERLIERADELGMSRLGRVFAERVTTRPLIHLGRAAEALPLIVWPWTRMACLAHMGRKSEAEQELCTFLETFKSSLREGELAIDIAVWVLETAVLVEDRETAAILADHLRPVAALSSIGFTLTCPARHLGTAAALLGDPVAARTYYEQALKSCARIRFRPEIALTRLHLAELLLAGATDEQPNALTHLDFAIGEFQQMGMTPSLDRARALKHRVVPSDGRMPAYPDGLSTREVEVLRLLATGKSNQEIADTLVLSVRTVENHTARIYAKIGARSRAEATAYAFRQGLS